MTQYDRSAIIGYYRMGDTIEQIAGLTGIKYEEVERLIKSFEKEAKISNVESDELLVEFMEVYVKNKKS